MRNAVSHVMAVAVSHYMIGKPDKRFKNIKYATDGAKKLYELVQKENDGLDIKVVYPFFISTTDDTTMFCFEGSVQSKEGEWYIINKDEDTSRSLL